MLTKCFQSTRLETRTKESNIYASIKVRKTLMHNESEGWHFSQLRWESLYDEYKIAPSTDLDIFFLKDLSKSISVGTRKMVNYACIG